MWRYDMLFSAWRRARDWVDSTVERTAVKRLTDSVNGRALRKALPVVLALAVLLVVLLVQLALLLLQAPQSFSAFALAGPALAVVAMALMAVLVHPSCGASVPLCAVLGFLALAALHSTVAALMNSVAPVNLELFAVIAAVLDAILAFVVGKGLIRKTVAQLNRRRDAPEPAPEPSEPTETEQSSDEEDDHGK